MATQPHQTPAPAANTAAPGPIVPTTAPAYSAAPGGMASDPAAALANEIVTNIKGAIDRAKLEQISEDLVGSVAVSIRRFADAETAKVTAGGSGLHANVKASEK